MPSRPRVLILDLDGTLLPANKRIPSSVRKAVHTFRYDHGAVLVATARRVPTALPYVRDLKANLPTVAENGAQIVDPMGRVLRSIQFPQSVWKILLEEAIPFVATIRGENYIWGPRDLWKAYLPYPGTHILKDPGEIRHLPSPTRVVVPQGISLPSGPFHTFSQPDGTLHLAPLDVSKREGVLWVLRMYGWAPHQALFMGDGGVDLPLFFEIPWGVTPRDADERLAHYARWEMAPPHQEGAAFFLKGMGWACISL